MFIRATTIAADPARLDEGIRFTRDVVAPALSAVPGSLGLSMYVDRDTGTSTVSSAWETRGARDAAQAALDPLRARAAGIVGGLPVTDLFELAVLERRRPAEPGFWSRMTRVSIDPHRMETAIDAYRSTTLPALELLDGYCSAALLVDYGRGAGISSVVFDSRASLDASRDQGEQIRRTSTAKAGAEVVDVRESEIVIAGMRLPQTA